MKEGLTIAYTTSRFQPEWEYFFVSFRHQITTIQPKIIVVDTFYENRTLEAGDVLHVPPKPTIWQGKHRITKEDWWAVANARNTALALCDTEYIAFVDDRSVLAPTWLQAARAAMFYHYVACGPYQKVHDLVVKDGVAQSWKPTDGTDSRTDYVNEHYKQHAWLHNPYKCPGAWCYGCSIVMPLEFALAVNGYPEDMCDGLSAEDTNFGLLLENNGFPIYFDERMGIIEDRTPGKLEPVMKRTDKGVSPKDKSHAALEYFQRSKTSGNSFDLRQLREDTLAGKLWPAPSAKHFDWYDQQPISEM